VAAFTVDTAGIRALATAVAAQAARLSTTAHIQVPATSTGPVDGALSGLASVIGAHIQATATAMRGQAQAAQVAAAAYEHADSSIAGTAHAAKR
jgi:hypothetical protein